MCIYFLMTFLIIFFTFKIILKLINNKMIKYFKCDQYKFDSFKYYIVYR